MPTSFAESVRPATAMIAMIALLAAVACGSEPVAPPANADCDGVDQPVLHLERFEARVLTGSAVHCTVLAGGGATYLVMPQMAGAGLPYGGYGFRIGDPHAGVAVAVEDLRGREVPDLPGARVPRDAQRELDAALRERESFTARRWLRPRAADHPGSGAPHAADPDSLREFRVLNTLDATPTWAAVGSRLRFAGARVAIYVDTLAADAFTETELQAMGSLYDVALAPRVFDAFGPGSDLDADGRVLFLLTPTVNALIPGRECATRGYVRGFFYSHDLASAAATSNRGEVFYGFVPDPAGIWSCAHSKADVLANLPPTFMHELQHMISFGAHAIARGGASEEPWLNEGLSHIAEELGSIYWEERFPAPTGRTDPAQLFPDSAAAYINPNVLYSYRFLFSSAFSSLLGCAPGSFCSLNERGGVWLFLRWIADRRQPTIFRSLVQTALTGRANLEAVSGMPAEALLGDFAIATIADSIAGHPRARVAPEHRFATRNLRAIYQRLFETVGLAGGVARPFPIEPLAIAPGATVTGTMRPGTLLTYRLSVGVSVPSARLRFAVPDGSPFPASQGAQVSIFRLP